MLLSVLRGLVRSSRTKIRNTESSLHGWLERGLAHQSKERWAEAEEAIRRALSLDPDNPDVLHVLGTLLHRRGRSAEAKPLLERAARSAPGSAAILMHLAGVYHAVGQTEQAIATFGCAIDADPSLPASYSNLGNVLKQTGQLQRAEHMYREALAINPQLPEAWHNLGSVQRDLGHEAEALESFDHALALDPQMLDARYSRALTLLGSGNLADGWEAFEVRLQLPRSAHDLRSFGHPTWRGEPLVGSKILVWGEQGIGDEIVFAGLYPDLLELDCDCVFECSAKLVSLFARSFPLATVVARSRPPHAATAEGIAYQIAAGSLARYLRPSLASFPARTRYLVADPSRVRHWRERLDALGSGLKVGFSWRSMNLRGERVLACSRLDEWGELLRVAGVHWICLQYDECATELERARSSFGVPLHRFDDVDYFDDLDETAALMQSLDLVITGPTTVSVLAGALGVPTWQMHYGADWQTLGTDRLPWLPALVRFQRAWDQPWQQIFTAIARQLTAIVSQPTASAVREEPPDEARKLLETALAQYRTKDFLNAERSLEQGQQLAPANMDFLLLRAVVLQAQGRSREALELLTGPHGFDARTFELQVGIARAAAAAGELEVAVAAYRKAVAERPELAELHAGLATIYESLKREEAAIGAYRQALALNPRYAGIQLNLGRLLQRRGDLQEARACFEAELMLNPRSAKSLFNLGVTIDQLGDSAAAEQYYRDTLQIDPEFADARINLGVLLSRRGEFSEAIAQLERGGHGGLAGVHFNRAVSLAQEGRIDEARSQFALAARVPAGEFAWHNDTGIMFFIHGCMDEARELIEHAAASDQHSPRTQFNLALVRLAAGPSVAAWEQFGWRFRPEVAAAIDRKHPFAEWRGEPLQGRTLLVWGEQGVGDEMLFAGMYPQLEASGARVIFECKPKLVDLFARSFPWARVVERLTPPVEEVRSGIDYQIAAGTLGKFLRASLDMFPVSKKGYLHADAARARYWRDRLSELGAGLKVGFCWRSSNTKGERALSCTRLDDWAELFAVPGIDWICLQYDRCDAELEAARVRFGVALHRFHEIDYFDDLDEVAALTVALDLVISAPTTVSIQTPALGVETWQLSYGVDWQTHGTDRNPWLPAMTRFQRRWDQSWTDVLCEIAARLHVRAARST